MRFNTLSARWASLACLLAALAGCSSLRPTMAPSIAAGTVACQVVFDAGSSGTRLYIYAKDGAQWTEHPGPRTGALADPVRQIRGKTHADIDAVTNDVVAQLERIRAAGPARNDGRPEWPAFDWSSRCTVTDAMVLATAGMRIAEQEDATRSRELWGSLQRKLQQRMGPTVKVSARSLTGFEEGLFAWLAVREKRADHRFGIAEMGGASSQVTFPCPGCDTKDDAVRTVQIKGQPIQMYSYSFLGLGQDEAPTTLGLAPSCSYGAALTKPGWQRSDCEARIDVSSAAGLKDPYNFQLGGAGANSARGAQRLIPTGQADVSGWVLTGAFNYMDPAGVANCCERQGQCFQAATSCFRAVYLDKYLEALNIPTQSAKADVSWTQGAVLCAESQCLKAAPPPVCRWSASGCL
jgi:GDA1/CD39 (nucleoside phosphatase) family